MCDRISLELDLLATAWARVEAFHWRVMRSNENKISYGHWDCGQAAEKVS
jgi:hypothetical protein